MCSLGARPFVGIVLHEAVGDGGQPPDGIVEAAVDLGRRGRADGAEVRARRRARPRPGSDRRRGDGGEQREDGGGVNTEAGHCITTAMALVDRLAELVSFDTQNPDGEERPLVHRLAGELAALGARTVDEVTVGRPRLRLRPLRRGAAAPAGERAPRHRARQQRVQRAAAPARPARRPPARPRRRRHQGGHRRRAGGAGRAPADPPGRHPVLRRRGARRHLHRRVSRQRGGRGARAGDRLRADRLPRGHPPPRHRRGHRVAGRARRALLAGRRAGQPDGGAGARGGGARRDGRGRTTGRVRRAFRASTSTSRRSTAGSPSTSSPRAPRSRSRCGRRRA